MSLFESLNRAALTQVSEICNSLIAASDHPFTIATRSVVDRACFLHHIIKETFE